MTPTIVIDTREQTPLSFRTLKSVPGTITTGDYSVLGAEELFSVERKSIQDLVMSVTSERDRFERELHRLRGYRFKRLLIVGKQEDVLEHRYRSKALPKSVIHTLQAFEVRYDVPVIWADDATVAAECVERWAYWFSRETVNAGEKIAK